MWIFLNNAFLSIVQDKDDSTNLMVRARFRGDIERVFPGIRVSETPSPADYRFRARVARERVADVMRASVERIDYTNFKNSIPYTESQRHWDYSRVWALMGDAQHREYPPNFDDPPTYGGSDLVAPINRRGKKAARPRSSRR